MGEIGCGLKSALDMKKDTKPQKRRNIGSFWGLGKFVCLNSGRIHTDLYMG